MKMRFGTVAVLIAAGAAGVASPAAAYGGCAGKVVECYEKVRNPDVYKTVAHPVVVKPGWKEVVETPAVVERRTDRVVATPGHWLAKHEPAVYGSYTERVLVSPAHVRFAVTPPTRRVIHSTVVVRPGRTHWVHKRGQYGQPVKCKVKSPPVRRTVARTIVEPGVRIARHMPAVYQTVERPMLVQPARTRHFYQPPVYGFVDRQVVVQPASRHVIAHPPVMGVAHRDVLVHRGGYGWRRTQSW